MADITEHNPGDVSPDSNVTDKSPKKPFFARFKKSAPDDDKKVDNEPSEEEKGPPPVKFVKLLFQYATVREKFYMFIAFVAAVIHGALMPMFTILFGRIINRFGDISGPQVEESALQEVVDEIGDVAKYFLVLGGVAFVSSLIQVRFQLVVAQRICARLRRMFFESVMSQDYTWIDENDGGELTTRVAGDVDLIQAGIGDKVTSAVQFVSMFFVGIIIAFVYGPLLTLVILALAPLLIIAGSLFAKLAADSTGDGLGAYGEAGAIAHETIALIRNVTAYNGQNSEINRYNNKLEKAYVSGIRKSVFAGIGIGVTFLIIFASYAIAFTFGSQQVRNGNMDGGDVLTTFFSVLIACMSIGQAAPSLQAIATAKGASPRVFEVIERKSEIDPLNEEDGEIIKDFNGRIQFKDVDFNYKNRIIDDLEDEATRQFVLNKFNIDVAPGTSQALVGSSGCGKSTTVRLIERFYDAQHGQILMDGVDVRQLNVRWLRSQIGYVGQMPTLFKLSIRDNIALGAAMDVFEDEKAGKTVLKRREVTEDDIIEAAKQANAHDFIMKLPEKYDTMLGERGALLSGGQKQRVCIARALVRNPKILLLDESTSALDSSSEKIVQEALERASSGRTTITIAHRLSTVKNADVISVIDKGTVVEQGTHANLIQVEGGAYRTLVEHQNIEAQKTDRVQDDDDEAKDITKGEAQVFTNSVSKTVHGVGNEEKDEDKEDDTPDVDKGVLRRAFMFNITELPYIILGMVGAAGAGATFPVMAILFSEAIFELVGENSSSVIRKWSLLYLALGGASFLSNFAQLTFLGISGEKLTRKVRQSAFRTILKQDIAFFDEKDNSLGSLTTRLATEASQVKGVTGDTLGVLSFAMSTILTGFLIAYLNCWRVALVVTAVFPLMAVAGAAQVKLMTGFDVDSEKKFAGAGAIAGEAVDNFDTVTSIGVQDVFINKYNAELEVPVRNGVRTALIAGIAFGASEFLSQALWAVSFWVGAIFVRSGDCSGVELFKSITGLLFAGMMLGNISAQMPDVTKANIAATKVFRLLDRQTKIDPSSTEGEKKQITGSIHAEKLCFEYPVRPDVPVLRGITFKVAPGQTLALVGASGCGKSTIVALLERFYDVRTGSIFVDDTEIRDYNVAAFRQQLGMVSQEPDLFNRSIRDNIAYGLDQSDGTPVTDEVITEAAKAANAHSFISELEDGYDFVVGPRGSRLSGGQRQRIAIARALVRQPKVLLLDESTSALDAVSERVVQEALDRASAGRTTVAIAHRLSTIKDADVIAVVSRGRIVEVGTHEQLLRIPDGEYATLVKNQMTETEDDE